MLSRDILVIEDNPADIRLIQIALSGLENPVTIHSVPDGDSAMQFLMRQGAYADAPSPRLIFLDFNLPKTNSREILRRIKADTRLRVIPVAVLTSSDVEKDVLDAYEMYANCYLTKAPDLHAFTRIIEGAARFWLDIATVPAADILASTSGV